MAVGMGDAHGGAARAIGVAGDAFMGDVEMLAVAVEQLPRRSRIGMRQCVGIAGVVSQLGHRLTKSVFKSVAESLGTV